MKEKLIEEKKCKQCNLIFEITNKDLGFYDKISPKFNWKKIQIPTPNLCPDCRNQRRLSFLNYSKLYKNVCDSCNKEIVSRFSKFSWIKNYCNDCWSSEDWNQLKQAVEIDFDKSFFEQIEYLIKNTYYQNLIGSSSNVKNNSVYTNHTSEINNSYFVFEANKIDESYYSSTLKNSSFVVDSMFVWNSQYLYENIDCYNMYNTFFCKNSYLSKFSYFLDNCNNCSYCIWCTNLVNKEYYLFNKPISQEIYNEFKQKLSDYKFLNEFRKKFEEFSKKQIKKSNNLIGSENCSWNNIINSNNCNNCFDVLECQDSKYCASINYSSDLYDISSYGEESNLMLDSVSVWRYSNNILFSSIVWKWENLIYCIDVKKSKNCFLCVNLENKQYCILNKQYSKQEYEELVPKIIEKMKQDWEWWEFFPSHISPFWYNETLVNEYYQLNKKEAIKKWFRWSDYEVPFPKVEKIIPANKLPDNIINIPDDILNWAIECEVTKKPFKIIKEELEFYRKHALPIPRRHPDQRHLDRIALRNKRKLFDRKCDKCKIDIKTTYDPNREEMVYCEDCYEKEIY